MRKRELLSLHKRLCKELGITPCKIEIREYARTCPKAYACYWPSQNLITLYTKNIAGGEIDPREAIAHETYHHYQYKKGWSDGFKWKGDLCEKWDSVGYKKKPWEAGAFRYQRKIVEREGW